MLFEQNVTYPDIDRIGDYWDHTWPSESATRGHLSCKASGYGVRELRQRV